MSPESPIINFDGGEPKLQEIKDIIGNVRAGSAPRPNRLSGITYKVYRNWPKLIQRLWKLLKVIWRKEELPENWLL